MRRNRTKLPIKPFLFVAAIVLAGIMIFNSGLLVSMGLMKGNIPEGIGIDPSDPRVIEKVDEAVDRNAIKDTVNKVLNLITGRVDQGVVTVIAHDAAKGFYVSGFTFELQDAITKQVIEVLTTDEEGKATSEPINYRKAYRIVQVGTAKAYADTNQEIVFEMKAPIMELRLEQKIGNLVRDYVRNPDGSIKITEMMMEVPLILQKPELPNGCEIVSLASILNYLAYPVDAGTLSDSFLDKSPFYRRNGKLYGADPDVAFSGDPRDPAGWFVYAPPTVKAGQAYIDEVSGNHVVVDITGSTESEVMRYIEEGIPVAIWATRDLSPAKYSYGWYLEADDRYFEAATNLHCMVIYGFVGDQLYVMDPLEGNMIYDQATFFMSYESLGSRALVVEEKTNE
ncbi:MAG TPA: hypothetical protein DCS67_09200 [Clostridiales bacterium UBA8960]|jgi:uncharacterized protein YvpB|nr:hypothetical protein [Clostridiales bacterium UBA8960]